MRTRMTRVLGGLSVAAVVGGGLLATLWNPAEADGQTTAFRAPRLVGTKNPDLNGIWQAMTTANWDILDHAADAGPLHKVAGAWGAQPEGRGIVDGNQIPYKPEARAKQKHNFENRLKFDPQNPHDMGDPEAKCYMAGVPRAMYMPYPIQILQTGDQLLMAFEYASASRIIHLKNHREAPVPSWMGWSNGRWEGDTLVVEVTSQNGNSWLDRAGNYASDTLKVTERYTLQDANHLMYEATLEDPAVFTRPFKIRFPLYRRLEANMELGEMKCVAFVEDYLYGSLRKKTSP
jgi:hypothetical protein